MGKFLFKIITKTIADRLVNVVSQILSPQQFRFGKRQASLCVNLLDKKSFQGNMALKIDIIKTFENLNLDFLLHVLHRFGFSSIFCWWTSNILGSARISILINGFLVGYINCSLGVAKRTFCLIYCSVLLMISLVYILLVW